MGSTEQPTFYDRHPFDWIPPDRSEDIHAVVSRLLVDFIEALDPHSLVIDVGCGPGRVLGFLAQRGNRCVGIDRSRVSVGLAVRRCRRPGVVGDNLRLPFADEVADAIVSDGVIHHTEAPEAAFAENLRILKPGGQMYLGVYKPYGRYPFLYKYPGGMIRRGIRQRWSKPLVTVFAQGLYFLVHFVRSKGKRTWAGAQNLFYDYFATPRVAFLSRPEIEDWCTKRRASVLRYDENRGGNIHSFILQKDPGAKAMLEKKTAIGHNLATTEKGNTA